MVWVEAACSTTNLTFLLSMNRADAVFSNGGFPSVCGVTFILSNNVSCLGTVLTFHVILQMALRVSFSFSYSSFVSFSPPHTHLVLQFQCPHWTNKIYSISPSWEIFLLPNPLLYTLGPVVLQILTCLIFDLADDIHI